MPLGEGIRILLKFTELQDTAGSMQTCRTELLPPKRKLEIRLHASTRSLEIGERSAKT
jgi:hypothetical protein